MSTHKRTKDERWAAVCGRGLLKSADLSMTMTTQEELLAVWLVGGLLGEP